MLDEAVANQLADKMADRIERIRGMEEAVFDELFTYSCPKFVTASLAASQLRLFLQVRSRVFEFEP